MGERTAFPRQGQAELAMLAAQGLVGPAPGDPLLTIALALLVTSAVPVLAGPRWVCYIRCS